jgi:hypothetical protein
VTAGTAFQDVPATPRGHLGLLFYQAADQLIRYLGSRAEAAERGLETVFRDFPFLQEYWEELGSRLVETAPHESASVERECEFWEESRTEWLPFIGLRLECGLSRNALLCLVMSGLVEEDARFAGLFSTLQQPLAHRRPTLGLLQAVMRFTDNAVDVWSLCRPMLDAGLLEVPNRDNPRSEWQLRVPMPLWNALRGEITSEPAEGIHYHAPETFAPVNELILPPAQIARLSELGPLLQSGQSRSLIVRGTPGCPRLETAGSVARLLGRGVLEVKAAAGNADEHWLRLGPLSSVTRALPAFCVDLGPGGTFNLLTLPLYRGPVAVVMGREGGVAGAQAERSVTVSLDPEGPDYRLRNWQRALEGNSPAELKQIAASFALPSRYIARAAPLAQACAALERRTTVTMADVRQAVRSISRERLDSLAARLDDGGHWSHLVVVSSTENDLYSLERRCRHREQLSAALGEGLPGGLNRGVRALFEGPSGTGKTLAARVLAAELGIDVYRVDLAAIVNKYIGETEKNLSRVLSYAEDLDVILLLDEGDALMTRRTDVKSSNDRYANLETNYLLQRLETYTGIVIVTTNVGNYIDSAFRRRMDVVVKFHLPDAEERWRLWQLHLPTEHAIDSATLEQVSLGYAMTGGQIRNAAVHATLLAAEASRNLLTAEDLRSGISIEYRKAGAAIPGHQTSRPSGSDGRLAGFLSAIS